MRPFSLSEASIQPRFGLLKFGILSTTTDWTPEKVALDGEVTPTAFLELINTFKSLIGKQQKAVGDLRDKYLDSEIFWEVINGVTKNPKLQKAKSRLYRSL